MPSPEAYLVIMAGGSGTRFWPKSTSKRPKQLLSFSGADTSQSLLNQTLRRFDGIVDVGRRLIVTTESLKSAVAAQAPGVKILAEPQPRNTAPCIYWAARVVAQENPKAIMLVMPSDHYIPDLPAFSRTIRLAIERAATRDELVTLGIQPSRPETGYGYLRAGQAAGEDDCRSVEAFVEKPDLAKAREFVRAGNYFWNGGMFAWRAEMVLRAFDQFMPEMKRAWDETHGEVTTAYPRMTATSIDYGIMEKARNVVMFPLDCGWDDLGSWTSLENLADRLQARQQGSVVVGGEIVAVESQGNIVDASQKLVALLGVNDLIVVDVGEAILVADKKRAQDIRLIVEAVKKQRPELA